MDDHQAVSADAAFLVSGATLDDESIGPLWASCADAHRLARTVIAKVGGTVRILRNGPGGWFEVARYTDTGRHSSGSGMAVNWAAIEFADEIEVDWPGVGQRGGWLSRWRRRSASRLA